MRRRWPRERRKRLRSRCLLRAYVLFDMRHEYTPISLRCDYFTCKCMDSYGEGVTRNKLK